MGISFVAACSQVGEGIPVRFSHLSELMTMFLVISLVSVYVYLPLNRFQANKWLGVLLFAVYLTFLTLAILQEADVFWPDVV